MKAIEQLMDVMEDFVDLRIAAETSTEERTGRWYEWFNDQKRNIQSRFKTALDRYVTEHQEDTIHQSSLLR